MCSSVRGAPPRAKSAPWPASSRPWHRVHIDYLKIGQNIYLVIIDSYSKWLEYIYMNNGTSTTAMIRKLKIIFSVIVSDNDPKINSGEK